VSGFVGDSPKIKNFIKKQSPIEVTLFGIIIHNNDEQLKQIPIELTLYGIVIHDIDEQ
jgi:hypothetical protein